jgi:hypothetical protein
MIYRLQVFFVRLLNRLPKRRALIKQIASQEWAMQNICDQALGLGHARYEPGAWWRLSR